MEIVECWIVKEPNLMADIQFGFFCGSKIFLNHTRGVIMVLINCLIYIWSFSAKTVHFLQAIFLHITYRR